MSKILFALSVMGAILVAGGIYHTMRTEDVVPSEVLAAFNAWKINHGTLYGTASEANYRLTVFYDNYRLMQNHNVKNLGWTLGMTLFADITEQEFATQYMGLSRTETTRNDATFPAATDASVDWTTKGAVTPVKNQGQCGSCWAFSATGGMEGAYFLKTGKLVSMSEQHLVDCATKEGNMGCQGGLPEWAFTYAKRQGIEAEADYKYTGRNGTCAYDASKVVAKVASYTTVPKANSDELLKAVAQQPVSIGINASGIGFQLYFGGIMNPWLCAANLDHGVMIVGYGADSSKLFWKVKNSWGATWGEKGYFRIARKTGTGVGKCGLTEDATVPMF